MSRKAKSTIARDELEKRIGYTFADKSILDRALTHISAASPKQGRGGSYQRLEFLGDHVLGLVISDMLYRAFPKGDEGEVKAILDAGRQGLASLKRNPLLIRAEQGSLKDPFGKFRRLAKAYGLSSCNCRPFTAPTDPDGA